MGVPYTEHNNHLHGQWLEFRIRNNAQKMKANDVKMILSSLAYITPIRLLFCMCTDDTHREKERGRERERIFVKRKMSKSVINHFTVN